MLIAFLLDAQAQGASRTAQSRGEAPGATGVRTRSANVCPAGAACRKTAAHKAACASSVGRALRVATAVMLAAGSVTAATTALATTTATTATAAGQQHAEQPAENMFIREYRVQGSTVLPVADVQRAVYPYLGPGRSAQHVEAARAALQALYHDRGYKTVSVEIPQQKVRRGVVVLRVSEVRVGRLTVSGSRYHDLEEIRRDTPSLAENSVPDFNAVVRDIVSLNQTSDRSVVPELKPGAEPGTVDVELKVEDKLPVHGSLELNNRNSTGTSALRLNGSLRYDNLWQMGHGVGASFQISPQDINEVKVFSGYYLARFKSRPNLSLMLSGTVQDTNISTLGNAVSAGKGETVSLRASYVLPASEDYYHSVSAGLDYKHSRQSINTGSGSDTTPLNYIPFNLSYTGMWRGDGQQLDIYTGLTMHFRGAGSSDTAQWEENRVGADGNFIILRGDFGYTFDVTKQYQGYVRVHGQLADSPLISAEQFGAGGLDTVRGYYEGELLGDLALFSTLELRGPELPVTFRDPSDNDSLRPFAFVEGGVIGRRHALPGEKAQQGIASFGIGASFGFLKYFNGSVNLGVPMVDGVETKAWHPRLIFVIRGEF